MVTGIGQHFHASFVPDGDTTTPGVQVKRLQVQGSFRRRIAGVQELEAPVAEESVHHIGGHATTGLRRRFEHRDVVPPLHQ